MPRSRQSMLFALLLVACGDDSQTAGSDGTTGGTGATSTAATGGGETTGAVDSTAGTAAADSAGDTAAADTSGGAVDPGPGIDLQCGGIGGAGPDDGVICFFDVEQPEQGPAANMEYQLVDLGGMPAIYVKLTFAPSFADNTYGTEAIGWPNGHDFGELVGSDHAQIVMSNVAGEVVLDFELDYIDDDDTAPSGYRCLGVWDGNGKMNAGDASAILAANSSLSRNLNERGYDTYVVDSPATDDNYTPNPATPDWDYRIIYEVWGDATLFGEAGEEFTEACVQSIHASPAKGGDNTVDVLPDDCPTGWGCFLEDGCDECLPGATLDPDGTQEDPCDPTDGYPPVP